MKKAIILLLSLMIIMCLILTSCDENAKETDKIASDDITIDSIPDIPSYEDEKEQLYNDLDVINENDFKISYNQIKNDFFNEISKLDFEITDFKSDNNPDDSISHILVKNGLINMKSRDEAITIKLFEDGIAILNTANGRTSLNNIPLLDDNDKIIDSLMVKKEQILSTFVPGEYKLSKEYLRKLSNQLTKFTGETKYELIKNAEVYIYLDEYIESKLIKLTVELDGHTYNAELSLDGLVSGSGNVSARVTEEEKELLNIKLILNDWAINNIQCDLLYEEKSISLSYDEALFSLKILKGENVVTELELQQKNSSIEGLYDYEIKLKSKEEAMDLKLSIVAKSNKNNKNEYSLNAITTDEEGKTSDTATIISPSETEIILLELEEKIIKRYDTYLKNYEKINANAESFAKKGALYFTTNYYYLSAKKVPDKYYVIDKELDLMYLATYEYDSVGRRIIYASEVVIDYENHTYWYNKVNADFSSYDKSGKDIDILEIVQAIEEFEAIFKPVENNNTFCLYEYIEEQNYYLCVRKTIYETLYYTLTPEEFEVFSMNTVCCPIYYVNDTLTYHIPVTSGYDEYCKSTFTCGQCGLSFIAKASTHDFKYDVITEETESTKTVTVGDCIRCEERLMNINNECYIKLSYRDEGYVIYNVDIVNPAENMVLEIPSMPDADIIGLIHFRYGLSNYYEATGSFKKLSLPSEMKYIYMYGLAYETIEELILPESLYQINSDGIYNCEIKEIIIPEKTRYLDDYCINWCKGLERIVVNAKYLESMGRLQQSCQEIVFNGQCNNFYCPTGTKCITLPIGTITLNGINYCYNLEKIIIPEGTSQIKAGMFKNSKSFSELVIPSTVAFIDDGAFEGCENLKNITIPSTVKKISENAFNRSYITEINFDGTIAQWNDLQLTLPSSIKINYLKEE